MVQILKELYYFNTPSCQGPNKTSTFHLIQEVYLLFYTSGGRFYQHTVSGSRPLVSVLGRMWPFVNSTWKTLIETPNCELYLMCMQSCLRSMHCSCQLILLTGEYLFSAHSMHNPLQIYVLRMRLLKPNMKVWLFDHEFSELHTANQMN